MRKIVFMFALVLASLSIPVVANGEDAAKKAPAKSEKKTPTKDPDPVCPEGRTPVGGQCKSVSPA
jgi:hypothetical protein